MSQTVCLGGSVTLSVTTTGGNETYQWFTTSFGLIPGATNSTLTINPLNPGDDLGYFVSVTNACATVVSNVAFLIFGTELGEDPCTAIELTTIGTVNGDTTCLTPLILT